MNSGLEILRELPASLPGKVVDCLRTEADILSEASGGDEFGATEAVVPVIAHALEGAGLSFAEATSTASLLVEAILPPPDVLDETWEAMKSLVARGSTRLEAVEAKYAARRLGRAAGVDRETARRIVHVLGTAARLNVEADWRDSDPVPTEVSAVNSGAHHPEAADTAAPEPCDHNAATPAAGRWDVPPIVDFGTVPAKTEAVREVDVETPGVATVTTMVAGLQLDPIRLAGGRARLRLALDAAHLLPGILVMGDVDIACGEERQSLGLLATVAISSSPLKSAASNPPSTPLSESSVERYTMMLKLAYADGLVNSEERALLNGTRQDLGLDEGVARQLEEMVRSRSTLRPPVTSVSVVPHPSRAYPALRVFPPVFFRPRTVQDVKQIAVASYAETRARMIDTDPKEAFVGAVAGGVLMAAIAGGMFGAVAAVVAGLVSGGVGGFLGSSMPALPRAFSRRDVAQASGLVGLVMGILAVGILSASAFATLLTGREQFMNRLFGFLLNVAGSLIAGSLVGVAGAAVGVLGFVVGSFAVGLYRRFQP